MSFFGLRNTYLDFENISLPAYNQQAEQKGCCWCKTETWMQLVTVCCIWSKWSTVVCFLGASPALLRTLSTIRCILHQVRSIYLIFILLFNVYNILHWVFRRPASPRPASRTFATFFHLPLLASYICDFLLSLSDVLLSMMYFSLYSPLSLLYFTLFYFTLLYFTLLYFTLLYFT